MRESARARNPTLESPSPDDAMLRLLSRKSTPRRWLPAKSRLLASAAMAAVIVGIFMNALVFQREHHPLPFSARTEAEPKAVADSQPPAPVPAPAPILAPAPTPASSAAPSPPAVATPPARPARLAAALPAPSKPTDPIGELIRGKDTQKLLASARSALTKLGYSVHGTGSAGADTTAALRDFEKTHGLPLSSEITPRVVKQLVAAVNAR